MICSDLPFSLRTHDYELNCAQLNLCITAALKKTENWFPIPVIASCRAKVLQNAQHSAILSNFNKLPFVIKPIALSIFLSGHFTQVFILSGLTGIRNFSIRWTWVNKFSFVLVANFGGFLCAWLKVFMIIPELADFP